MPQKTATTSLRVLVTNDDGIDSPFFAALLSALQSENWCGQLRFVAPAEEHSWIAQAATPKRPVFVSSCRVAGAEGFTCSGTPADCASLGIDSLFPERPDLVISGINLGSNAGLAYYLSSGTVGAARQAFLSGVPAIALSVRVPGNLFTAWSRHDLALLDEFSADWLRLARAALVSVERIVSADLFREVDLISINLPWEADAETPAAMTELQRSYYHPLFAERAPQEYIHRPAGLQEIAHDQTDPERLQGDIEAMSQGLISVTPIKYELRPREQDFLKRLERALGMPKE